MSQNKYTAINPLIIILFVGLVGATGWLLTGKYYFLAPLPTLGAILFLVLLRYPQFGYYLIVFLIPFSAIMEELGFAEYLTISKFVGIWLVLYVIFRIFIDRKSSLNLSSNLWLLLACFFIVNLLSAITSEFTFLAFNNIRQLLTAYLFYALTLIFVTEKGFRKTLPTLVAVSVTLNAVLSVIGFLFLIPPLSIQQNILRATGFTGDPNFLASMSLFALPLIACQIGANKKTLMKIFFIFAFFIVIAAVVFSFSRASARVLLVVLGLMAFVYFRKLTPKNLGFVSLLVAIAIAITLLVIPQTYWERQKNMDDSSINRRISYIYVAWDIFKEHPFLGVGPGAFREEYAHSGYASQFAKDSFSGTRVQKKYMHSAKVRKKLSRKMSQDYGAIYRRFAHNTYLEVVSGSGGLGLLIFFGIIFVAIKNYLNAVSIFNKNGDEQLALLSKSYLISMIGLMVAFLFLSSLYHKFLWLPLALSQISLRLAKKEIGSRDDNIN